MSNKHRKVCFEKYEKKCSNCQSNQNVEVHHIDGDADNNALGNLIPLCRDCHIEVESNCWTEDLDDPIQGNLTPLQKALIDRKRVESPNTEASKRPKVINGFTQTEKNQIRELKGHVQVKVSGERVTIPDAIIWAVENELERMQE